MKSFLLSAMRLFRGVLVTALAVVIIGAAVVIGAGRLLAPYADHLRPHVQQMLSERLARPVSIDRIEATWGGLTPVLELTGVRVGDPDEQTISMQRLQLEFKLRDWFVPGRSAIWMVFTGLELALVERDDGQWTVGVGAMDFDHGGRTDIAAVDLGNLLLVDSRLRLQPLDTSAHLFELPEVRLRLAGDSAALAGRIQPAGGAEQAVDLRLIAQLQGSALAGVRAWSAGRNLAAAQWLEIVPGIAPVLAEDSRLAFEGWLDWRAGGDSQVIADLELRDWPMGESVLAALDLQIVLQHDDAGAQFDITRLALNGESALERLSFAANDSEWAVAADAVSLQPLHALAYPWLDRWFELWLAKRRSEDRDEVHWGIPQRVAGQIETLELAGDFNGGVHAAHGRIHGLEVAPVTRIPGVTGLDLELGLHGDLLAVEPVGQAPVVDWSGMLREPVELTALTGRVLLGPDMLVMEDLAISHPEADAKANGLIGWAGRQPFLDFHIDVPRFATTDARPRLPAAIIPEAVLAWMDHALTDRQQGSGYLQFFGYPRQWPWDGGEGEFRAHIDLARGNLGVYPGWPGAGALVGQLVFAGRGFEGFTTSGRIAGMDVARVQARIADFQAAELELDITAPALPADGLIDFLEQAPILGESPGGEGIAYRGAVNLDLAIVLPLAQAGADHWRLSGRAESVDLAIAHAQDLFELDQIHGAVAFSRERIGPAQLAARLNGGEVIARIEGQPEARTTLTLEGELTPWQVIPPAWQQLLPEDRIAHGRSRWLIVAEERGDQAQLRARSDLVGTALALPAPLAKPEDSAWDLDLALSLKPEMDAFSFELAQGVSLRAARSGAHWRWGLGLGGTPATVPERETFLIAGTVNRLDLGGWMRLAGLAFPGLESDGATRGRMRLQVDDLRLGTRGVRDLVLDLRPEAPYWLLDISGAGASGQLRLPASASAANLAVADFGHLHLSEPEEQADVEEVYVDRPRQMVTIDPRSLPDLHLLVEDFRLGELEAGLLRIEAHGTVDGLEVETLQAGQADLRLSGQGNWIMRDSGPWSDFSLNLNFLNARRLMRAAGIDANLEAASGKVALNASWPGSPMDFDLRFLTGELALDIANGSLPEARPGLGRVLGLISLTALPRRLQLDFSDVVGTGFGFDSLKGDFRLDQGQAVTDELRIDSPAAKIRISGTTDLKRQEYDQTIVIRPGLGATLPVVGAIAGGPGGAAVGLALQGLFGGQLRDVGELRYRVTGPWADPIVESVGVE